MIPDAQDAYGHEVYAQHTGESSFEIVERDDGFISFSMGPQAYFAPYAAWPDHQKAAIQHARGRVLDIGCGAGRVALYLQEQGLEVLSIDNSPLAVEVCRQRGVRNVSLTPITQVSGRLGQFDTIVMFGNNFGLFGGFERGRRLLKKFHRLTSPTARLLVESNDVYATTDPVHLAYHERNRRRGRMAGQLRLRVRFRQFIGPWFDYLLVSKDEMKAILDGTGWQVTCFFDATEGPMYTALIEKVTAI